MLALRKLWTAVTDQQACQPADTALIGQHPSGSPAVASRNGCQPTKSGRMPPPTDQPPKNYLVVDVPGAPPHFGGESFPRCGTHRCRPHGKARIQFPECATAEHNGTSAIRDGRAHSALDFQLASHAFEPEARRIMNDACRLRPIPTKA